MKKIIIRLLPFLDIILIPFVYMSALVLRSIRRIGVYRLPVCKKVLINIGVFPILDQYYEPQFDYRINRQPFSKERILPGIDWNIREQLKMLDDFCYADELMNISHAKTNRIEFYFNNDSFESGDAEYWYQIIRTIKPQRVIEIGSGYSTLMAINAIKNNHADNSDYNCRYICIEPYPKIWIEEVDVELIKQKVEDLDVSYFEKLEKNDILFIDSSHIIRPQGDVLFEYLQLLPSLNRGVIVHVHDIFSPKNYPKHWLEDEVRFWNEQYLLEAFLSHNNSWKIIGALNFLHHNYYQRLKIAAPFLTPEREPGSFYLQKL